MTEFNETIGSANTILAAVFKSQKPYRILYFPNSPQDDSSLIALTNIKRMLQGIEPPQDTADTSAVQKLANALLALYAGPEECRAEVRQSLHVILSDKVLNYFDAEEKETFLDTVITHLTRDYANLVNFHDMHESNKPYACDVLKDLEKTIALKKAWGSIETAHSSVRSALVLLDAAPHDGYLYKAPQSKNFPVALGHKALRLADSLLDHVAGSRDHLQILSHQSNFLFDNLIDGIKNSKDGSGALGLALSREALTIANKYMPYRGQNRVVTSLSPQRQYGL